MCYRCYFTLVQGTWFHQIAFSLYSVSSPDASGYKPGVMNLTEPENIMVVTLMYSWHLIGCAVGRFTNEMRSLKPLSFSFFLFDNVFLASLNSFYYNQTYLFFFAFISFFLLPDISLIVHTVIVQSPPTVHLITLCCTVIISFISFHK